MDLTSVKKRLAVTEFEVADCAFDMRCKSLRPYTRFYVLFDKLDYTDFCMQYGKRIGEPLISDGYGNLNFTFFWNRENEKAVLDNPEFKKIFETTIGNKIIVVTDKSGTSVAMQTIPFINNSPDAIFNKLVQPSNIIVT